MQPNLGSAVRRALGVFLCALVSLPAVPSLAPGDGAISNRKLDITVYFTYAETDFASWEPVFTEFSKLLYDATEKQLQLGKVTFTRCAELKDRADVWVLADQSGAQAHLNGLGVLGRHMTISQAHKSTAGNAPGQFGLVHEAGHYLWGLRDEYKGVVGQIAQPDPLHFCVSENGTIASIMDGGTAVTPNNQRTEFCTASFTATKHWRGANNGAGQPVKNMQEHHHGQSCWDTMVASRVGALQLPADEPRSDLGGHQSVVFAQTVGDLALMLLIDRSGSMSGAPIALARQGAQVGVGLLRESQRLGVVSFANDARADLGIAELSASHRADAGRAIGAIAAGGGTAIGSGLLEAQAQLDTVDGCSEVIVLLSDGVSNTGPTPNSVLPMLIQKRTRVYCIGLGNANVAVLTNIATRTHGRFFLARGAGELPGIFQQILAEAQGGVLGTNAPEQTISAGEQQSRPFAVSSFADRVLISLGYAPGSTLALRLVTPDNRVIDRTNFTAIPGARFLETSVQQVFDIPAPQTGAWSTTVVSAAGSGASTYDLVTINLAPALSVVASFGSGQVTYPKPMPVSVQVVAGWPVAGARVNARVTGPGGGTLGEIPLFDDGLPVHGDEAAGDGVYSALFHGYRGNGIYSFAVDVENVDGRSANYNECPPLATLEEGTQPMPIAPFQAIVVGASTVSGVPGTVTPGQVTLAAEGQLEGQDLTLQAAALTPVLDISLSMGASESVVVEALAVRGDGEVQLSLLGELGLYVDGDNDGRVDLPARPIATGTFGSSSAAIFTAKDAAPLLLGTAASRVRLLVTVGPERIRAAFVPLVVPPPSPLGGFSPWLLRFGALAGLITVVCIGVRHKRRVRLAPAVVLHNPRKSVGARARWWSIAASFAVLAISLTVAAACGGGGKSAQVRGSTGVLTLTMNPDDVSARGATSGAALTVAGTRVRTKTNIR